MKPDYRILNLGAGVQSTTLYLMFMSGEIRPPIDSAIFADTQEEPQAVYEHLSWLQSLGGPPILVRSKGSLGHNLLHGVNSTGQRFVSIPAFTKAQGDKREGRTRRQCSKEYKVEVIERTIRREILCMTPGQRVRGVIVCQFYGISLDEAGRAKRLQERMKDHRWIRVGFPLIERSMTRADCLRYLADNVPHRVPRSACVCCPYHSDIEWSELKRTDAAGWQRAVELDRALRIPGNVVNRNMNKSLYLHRSCRPLDQVLFDGRRNPRDLQLSLSFAAECEGVCGV